MKKIALAMCLLISVSLMFSLGACTKENGVEIKYATFTFDYTDKDGAQKAQDFTVKLYTNYAPETIAHFIKLCNDGFYNNTVVNTIESTWFSVGGYMNGDEFEKVTSGKTIKGEFAANGLTGNKLNIKKGSVIMYRTPANSTGSNYDTADCRFIICTSTAAPFLASEYCIIGEITDSDQIDALSDISALINKTENDETVYNRYYVGGIAEIAKSFLNENGNLKPSAAEKNIDLEDIEEVTEGGEFYYEAGKISDEDYGKFSEKARLFVNAISSKLYEYFYNMPVNKVSVSKTKVTNRA